MKTFYIFLCISIISGIKINAQSPDWLWAHSAGGTHSEYGGSIVTDAAGNVIVCGSFMSDSITFGTTTLINTSTTTSDIFLAKYDPVGNILWAVSVGGTNFDEGFITTDAGGNILMTGSYMSPSITFGSITLYNVNAPLQQMFLAKFDAAGNVLWANAYGGSDRDVPGDITLDVTGNIIVTGYFHSPTLNFGSTTLINSGDADVFIVKLNLIGNVMWAKSAGGAGAETCSGVTTDANGDIWITGSFSSTSISFDPGTILSNVGMADIFVAKYNSSGIVQWAKAATGSEYDYATDITHDGAGNVLITGYYDSPQLDFGIMSFPGVSPFHHYFVAKYDPSGMWLWGTFQGGVPSTVGLNIATDGNGNIITSGYYSMYPADFGTGNLPNAGEADIFVLKYNAAGSILWAKSAGGTSDDYANDLTIAPDNTILVTGDFVSPSIQFDTTTLTNQIPNLTSDYFVARLDSTNLTGISEVFNSGFKFSIFPNPTNGQFSIFSLSVIEEIKIMNLEGQEIYFLKPDGNFLSLNLENAGIYFVQITSEKQTVTRKMIVVDQ